MINEEQELTQYAKDLGRKLGFLLASLQVSEETKEAFFEIIGDFDLEQIERLTEILETKFVAEQTDFIEEDFFKQLQIIRNETLEKLDTLNQETIKRLSV